MHDTSPIPFNEAPSIGDPGAVAVPADHEDARAGTIALRYVRLRSPYPEETPAVFLAGGPGESGIDWLKHAPFRRAFEAVAAFRDVILLDQRGIGHSEERLNIAPPDFREGWLRDEETALAMLIRQAQETLAPMANSSAKAAPIVPARYTPVQSARDLAYLADALGQDRLHIWGHSYGTHLAQAALKVIPDRVERAVFCGFEGPNQTHKLPGRIQEQLQRLAALTARQGACADLLETMERVHHRLAQTPIVLELEDGECVSIGQFGLQWLVASWIGMSNRFVRLPELYSAIEKNDMGPLKRAARGFRSMLKRRPAAFYLNDAASGVTAARQAKIETERAACLLADACNFPFPRIREAWRQRDLGDAFRAPLVADHPIFVLTGSLDGFTPATNLLESATELTNLRHAQIENAAHNDLLTAETVAEQIGLFLSGGEPRLSGYTVPEPLII